MLSIKVTVTLSGQTASLLFVIISLNIILLIRLLHNIDITVLTKYFKDYDTESTLQKNELLMNKRVWKLTLTKLITGN